MLTGIETRWKQVGARPIATGAKPIGAHFDVVPTQEQRGHHDLGDKHLRRRKVAAPP